MGKYGDDLLYAGLGIGAVYLVYKLTKPVSDLATDIQGAAAPILSGAGSLGGSIISGIQGITDNTLKTAAQISTGNIADLNLSSKNLSAAAVNLGNTANKLLSLVTWPAVPIGSAVSGAVSDLLKGSTPSANLSSTALAANNPSVTIAYKSPSGVQYGTYQTASGGVSGVISPLLAAASSKSSAGSTSGGSVVNIASTNKGTVNAVYLSSSNKAVAANAAAWAASGKSIPASLR